MAYKEGIGENGKLPESVLRKIDTGQKLYIPASVSFMRMKNDAKKDGVNIRLVGAFSGYRPCGQKGDFIERRCDTGFTQWCAWEKYKAGVGNLASNPTTNIGCTSNHGWGIAIDVANNDAKAWIRKNGVKYGWWWGEAPSEDWHFTYDIKRDTFLDKNDIPSGASTTSSKSKIGKLIVAITLLGLASFIIYKVYAKKK
jgi:hypothetical protein